MQWCEANQVGYVLGLARIPGCGPSVVSCEKHEMHIAVPATLPADSATLIIAPANPGAGPGG